ncbi:protein lev-9-like [Saccoglossus kowalevskii]
MTQKTLICIRWYTFLVIFGYVSAQDSDNCPRKPDMIGEGRTCKKACTTNASCSENRECLCDDVCGFSCVNPTAICFQLESLENGQITVPENPVFGNEAIYTCNAGYRFSQPGESIRLCQGDREWSGTAPMCVIDVSCGPPPDVVNSLHDGEKDSYNVGDRVIYNCNSGYYRRGLAIIQCRSNGIWSNTAFECVARSCGSPGSIRNGRTIGNLFTFPNRVYYECNEGYNLIGRSYQACQTNMEWSGYQPECRPVSCPRLLPPDDGTMIGSTFTYDEVVIFRCNIGYKLHGSSQQRCQANGEWTGEHVSCRVINCGPPEPIYNGNRDRNFFGLDSVIFFECNDNYLLEGSRSTRCLENETWSTPTPKCWAQCVVNNPPRNTYITNRNVRIGYRVNHGTHLNYECTDENRYVLNHTQDAECFNGSWNMIPTCVAKPCQPLSDSDPHVSIQQEIIDGKVPHNKYAVYSCSRGYRLENEYQRRCQFGTWSRNTPSCIAKLCPRDGVIVNGNIKYLINNHEYSNPIHSRLVQDTQRLYECDNGYTLSNYDVRVPDLCDNEEWRLSDNMPYCSPANESIQMNSTVISAEEFRVNIESVFIREPQENIFVTGGGHSLLVFVSLSTKDSFNTILDSLQPWSLFTSILNRHGNISKDVGEVTLFPVASDFANVQIIDSTYTTVDVPMIIDLSNVSCQDFNSLCVRVEPSFMINKKEITHLEDVNSEKCIKILCSGTEHHFSISYLIFVITSVIAIHSCIF